MKRFKEREKIEFKRFKITEEDWRNREKWDAYQQAICDMVDRTSTGTAPWTLVEANDKGYARVKILRTICERLGAELEGKPVPQSKLEKPSKESGKDAKQSKKAKKSKDATKPKESKAEAKPTVATAPAPKSAAKRVDKPVAASTPPPPASPRPAPPAAKPAAKKKGRLAP